jgi:5,5'-dehydrodivanillate O-demethylase oxygenase subunit
VPVTDESMTTYTVSLRRAVAGDGREQARKPIDPDPLFLSEEILAGRMRVQDIDPAYRGLFIVQDNVALAGQGRITDRSKDWLGQSDRGIILLRKLWSRELKALAEGTPLKQWRRPKERLWLLVDAPKAVGAL